MHKTIIYLNNKRGQALVEFSMILPLMIMLIFATFAVGYWLNAKQIVTHAAYLGVKAAALTNDNAAIENAVLDNLMSLGIKKENLTREDIEKIVEINPGDNSLRARGSTISVTVRHKIPFTFFDMVFESKQLRNVSAKLSAIIECNVPNDGIYICN